METIKKIATITKITLNTVQLLNYIGIIKFDIPNNLSDSVDYVCDNIEDVCTIFSNIHLYIRSKYYCPLPL